MNTANIGSGIHEGIGIDDYHGGVGISKSGLDMIAKSPAIYYARCVNPDRPAPKVKAGQLEGNLAHCAILEPDEFDKRYAVGPDVNRSTKAWKDFAASTKLTPIKQDQRDMAFGMRESVLRLPDVAVALEVGIAESSCYWTDEATGVLCRARADWLHQFDAGAVILDVKTYSDASPYEFARQAARKRYHVQDGFYTTGYETVMPIHAFLFLVVELEWPYAAGVTMFDEDSRARGKQLARRDLFTYARCLEAKEWPGYSTAIETMRLPEWAL